MYSVGGLRIGFGNGYVFRKASKRVFQFSETFEKVLRQILEKRSGDLRSSKLCSQMLSR